jgi:hypothetical protein
VGLAKAYAEHAATSHPPSHGRGAGEPTSSVYWGETADFGPQAAVRGAFPCLRRVILTEIYLWHPWSCQEILRTMETPGQVFSSSRCDPPRSLALSTHAPPPPLMGGHSGSCAAAGAEWS